MIIFGNFQGEIVIFALGVKLSFFKFPLVFLTDSKRKWKSEIKYNFRWILEEKKRNCVFLKMLKKMVDDGYFPFFITFQEFRIYLAINKACSK